RRHRSGGERGRSALEGGVGAGPLPPRGGRGRGIGATTVHDVRARATAAGLTGRYPPTWTMRFQTSSGFPRHKDLRYRERSSGGPEMNSRERPAKGDVS